MITSSSTQWLITPCLEPLPSRDDLDRAVAGAENPSWAGSIIDRLIELRCQLQPAMELDGHGDIEDFIERTWRTHQALAAVGPENLWFDQHDGTMERLDGESAEIDTLLPRLGALRSRSFCHASGDLLSGTSVIEIPALRAVDQYFDSEVFLSQNRRAAHVIDTDLEQLAQTVARLAPEAPGRRLWIKARAQKSYLLRVQIPAGFEDLDLDAQQDALLELDDDRDPYGAGLAELFLSYEGTERGLLVAPDVAMTREYRLFVVDGQVISGAGCIEADTPLNMSSTSPFSLRMERTRGDGQVMTDTQALLRRYVDRATQLAHALKAEGRGSCVIDLAYLEETDEIVIVELNPITNAGFYASNIELIYAAWVCCPEIFTPELGPSQLLWLDEVWHLPATSFSIYTDTKEKP